MTAHPYTIGETLITLQGVGLTFGDGVSTPRKVVLNNVSVAIQDIIRPDHAQGQVVCFLGPSGVGKTQLSRIIAGLQRPTSGTVSVLDAPPDRGRVGMVPQHYPLFPFLRVQEHFALARRQSGEAASKERDLIEAFGLQAYLQAYPHELSGGTRQRVAIVRQLLCSEHVLVLDEPFSGLDLLMKQRAVAVIRQVAQLDTKNTIIVVTHDVTEGMSVADTVWLMGRERVDDAWTAGARIVAQYDLAADGLAWRDDIQTDPRFQALVQTVKARFTDLVPAGG